MAVKHEGMDPIKISMLGIRGAGKSSLISGLYRSMIENPLRKNNAITSFLVGDDVFGTISPECSLFKVYDLRKYNDVEKMMTDAGTSEGKEFHCQYRITSADGKLDYEFPVHLFDYEGGRITDTRDDKEKKTKLAELMSSIKDSDVILFVVDAVRMTTNITNSGTSGIDMAKCRKRIGASYFSLIMNALSESTQKEGVAVLTVLTKTDAPCIPAEYRKNNCEKLIQLTRKALEGAYAYAPVLKNAKGWEFKIIPVTSIGEGSSKAIPMSTEEGTEYKCELVQNAAVEQKNIDMTYTYAMESALVERAMEYKKSADELNELEKEVKKIWALDKKAKKAYYEEKRAKDGNKHMWKNDCARAAMLIEENFKDELEKNLKPVVD